MDRSQHVQALFISLASSTDNFLVGLSVGLSRKPLSAVVLWGIAVCNAAGCFLATSSGSWGTEFLTPTTANGIASLAFAYLAIKEYLDAPPDEEGSQSGNLQQKQAKAPPTKHVSLELALPMTLNNLAGGVTAGVLRISPWWNFFYALVMSVVTMWVGYRLGHVFSAKWQSKARTTNRSLVWGPIMIYLALSLQSLREVWA